MEKILNLIDGQMIEAQCREWLPCFEPATGQIYAECASSDERDVELAVQAAQKAFPFWSRTSRVERAALLTKLAGLLEKNLDRLAAAESRDNGKPITLARTVDIPRSVSNLNFFAEQILDYQQELFTGAAGRNQVVRNPLGVVGTISPWNLPLYLFTWKIAPALAAGNCVVAKPSEVTPMTAFLLGQLSIEAGFPAGVLNIVHGLGTRVGSALSRNKEIKAISFTGSTVTGSRIQQDVSGSFKKLSLEMGGKNPFLVFADVDLDKVTSWAVKAAFTNQGQICLCGSRFLVHEDIYPEFKNLFLKKTQALKLGDPTDPSTDQGALVSEEHFKKVSLAVDKAKAEGARILTGGKPAVGPGRCKTGYFFEPTVLEGLGPKAATNQDEIFGPVVTLQTFKTEDEAIALANDSQYGLAASVWGRNPDQLQRVASELQFGIVWLNTWMTRDLRTPFGGVKNSGMGREGGRYALDFFTEVKNICEAPL